MRFIQHTRILASACLAIFALTLAACDSTTDDPIIAIEIGTSVSARNTFQNDLAPPAGTGGQELSIEQLTGAIEGSLTGNAVVSATEVEFPGFVGLWDIDVDVNTITFVNITDPGNPPFDGFFRVLEPGTFDRYYFMLGDPLGTESVSSNHPAVTATALSTTEVLVTVGEGYDTAGSGFTVLFDD